MVNLEKGKKFAELIPNSKTHIIKELWTYDYV